MRFVIVGYGRVGSRTARVLQEEGHDVVVVERDEQRAERAADAGFEVVTGDVRDEKVLAGIGADAVDAIGALTGELDVNFAACSIGREFGWRTVMRIDADYREDIYEEYAASVDEIVYPERLGAAGAKTALLGGNFNAIGDLAEGLQVSIVTVHESSPIVGKQVNSLEVPHASIYAHGGAREPLTIPLPGTTVEAGDRLALLIEDAAVEDVRETLLGSTA